MLLESGAALLVGITLVAATVNGALGYGFSSLTVPVALLAYSSRVLSPALVLVEVVLNCYVLVVNRGSLGTVWRRMIPVIVGLFPGVLAGSFALAHVAPGALKLCTYLVLLPLILLQAAGIRRPVQSEKLLGLPVGFSVGSLQLLPLIVPSVAIGLPVGVFLIRCMNSERFRRICMSFDAWVVGFGLSRALLENGVLPEPTAYGALALTALVDCVLLVMFFTGRRPEVAVVSH